MQNIDLRERGSPGSMPTAPPEGTMRPRIASVLVAVPLGRWDVPSGLYLHGN
jgi:hypothetical protein